VMSLTVDLRHILFAYSETGSRFPTTFVVAFYYPKCIIKEQKLTISLEMRIMYTFGVKQQSFVYLLWIEYLVIVIFNELRWAVTGHFLDIAELLTITVYI
jgi:hypothetical protein